MQNKFTEKGELPLSIWLYLFHTYVHVYNVHGRLTQFSANLLNDFRNDLGGNFFRNLHVLVTYITGFG